MSETMVNALFLIGYCVTLFGSIGLMIYFDNKQARRRQDREDQ